MKTKDQQTPDGTRQGAWEVEPGLVRFALWAPGKKTVAVAGDFNDWNETADPMAFDEGGIWWCEVKIEDREHEYMYVVDGETYIGDPYATEVNWTDNGAHSVVHAGGEPFSWTDDDFHIPDMETRIVYEVHVGDFTEEGTFSSMTDQLDYLKDLGINVLELMPVFEFPGDFSWGYNPAYSMAVEKSYGTLNDFKNLVNEAHARGMAIVLDMVFNHVDHDHPFTQLYPAGENPFFNDEENPWGFPNLDHTSDAVKGYVHQIQKYWLEEGHVDGLRYDASSNIGYDEMNGVTFLAYDARQTQSFVHLIAEHVPEDPQLPQNTEINSLWHRSWHHTVVARLVQSEYEGYQYGDMDQLQTVLNPASEGYQDIFQVINFTEGHDWDRVIHLVQQNEDIADTALQKSVLGAAVLFTSPGIPMILYGQEVATDIPKESTLQEGHRPEWSEAFEDDGVKWLFECYKRLIWLRREEPALQTGDVEVLHSDSEAKLLFYRRFTEEDENEVLILLNFSNDEQTFEIELPRDGKYHEVLTDEDWDLDSGNYASSIPGSTARVLKRIG